MGGESIALGFGFDQRGKSEYDQCMDKSITLPQPSSGDRQDAALGRDELAPAKAKSRGAWVIGALGTAASLAGLVLLGQQALLSGSQLIQEADAGAGIERMKTEQQWLVGQGLAKERPVGFFAGFVGLMSNAGAFAGKKEMVGPWRAGWAASVAGVAGEKRWVISAPANQSPRMEAIYRHEEAHALAEESGGQQGVSGAWPSLVSVVLSREMERLATVGGEPKDLGEQLFAPRDWRLTWLMEARSEAFADAFACLSVARRGQAAMAECALDLAAARVFPGAKRSEATSLAVGGSEHAVEMASFISGQLDARKVSALSMKEAMDLCGGISKDSLGWMLARQGKATGFFSSEGKMWWMKLANSQGVERSQALSAWDEWRTEALSDKPAAAFGEFKAQVGGMLFEAKKLPDLGFSGNWRFDGYAGQALLAGRFEAGPGGPLATGAATMVIDGGPATAAPGGAQDPADEAARMGEALAGAAWTHWAMAKRMGVSTEKETARIVALMSQDDARRVESLMPAFEEQAAVSREAATPSGDVAKKLNKRRSVARGVELGGRTAWGSSG